MVGSLTVGMGTQYRLLRLAAQGSVGVGTWAWVGASLNTATP